MKPGGLNPPPPLLLLLLLLILLQLVQAHGGRGDDECELARSLLSRFESPAAQFAPAPAAGSVPRQVAPQVLRVPILVPAFALALGRAAVACAEEWSHEAVPTEQAHPLHPGVTRRVDPESTVDMGDLGLGEWFRSELAPRLAAAAGQFWPTFRPAPWSLQQDGWVLGYWPHRVAGMGVHHDAETVSFVIPLATHPDRGVGTTFPRWAFQASEAEPGHGLMYPGGLSHAHLAPSITRGRRLVLIGSFFSDPWKSGVAGRFDREPEDDDD